ncbi:hypothetical protein KGD82_16265 [Nocardiopsis eucommiae]|uniref:Uncharacterized protein n=1 Tax=Nocardiopsis eucommiae TaxID=2831970 RepID=A0A975L881_9ACTN|nr:hypothetical protein KGD82_16265 [Nocardiopsis eucommiae]
MYEYRHDPETTYTILISNHPAPTDVVRLTVDATSPIEGLDEAVRDLITTLAARHTVTGVTETVRATGTRPYPVDTTE